MKQAYNQQLSGYGFASFVYVLGSILLLFAAIYISPVFCGSAFEKKMMWSGPVEIEAGYADDKDEQGQP
jgi:hypothetical protein